jgi:hypothetical protein
VLGYGKGRFWRTAELVARHSEAQTGCPVTFTYSRREARRLIQSHGFRVTDLFVAHIFPYRIADYVQYRYVKAWPWSWLPQGVVPMGDKRHPPVQAADVTASVTCKYALDQILVGVFVDAFTREKLGGTQSTG